MDRFSKTCLVLIVLLLGVIAAEHVTPVQAQQRHEYTWQAFPIQQIADNEDNISPYLNKMDAKGWDLRGVSEAGHFVFFVLKK